MTPEWYAAFVSVCAAVGLEMKKKMLIASTLIERRENPSKSAIPKRMQVCPRVSHFVAAWSRQKKSGNLMIPMEPTKKKSSRQEAVVPIGS